MMRCDRTACRLRANFYHSMTTRRIHTSRYRTCEWDQSLSFLSWGGRLKTLPCNLFKSSIYMYTWCGVGIKSSFPFYRMFEGESSCRAGSETMSGVLCCHLASVNRTKCGSWPAQCLARDHLLESFTGVARWHVASVTRRPSMR